MRLQNAWAAAKGFMAKLGVIVLMQSYLSPDKEGDDIPAYILYHAFEEVVTLKLVDYQRILLFIGSILHRLLEVIHIPQMLLREQPEK